MKAAVITRFGGPEVFQIQEFPNLLPSENEVLIEVKAAGVNMPDVFQRKGNYPAPVGVAADIPGLEVSGVIQQVGSAVQHVQVGDEVFVLLAGGGYASQVVVDAGLCIKKPKNLSFEEAASLPETLFTVWHNLVQRGGLRSSDRILIHGGSGGIGSMAIQIGHLFGAKVYTTVSSKEKADFVKNLGADVVINYQEQEFEMLLREDKITLVLDAIGGPYFAQHMELLEPDGRLIQINATQGAKVELNLLKMMQKRISISGSTLRIRDLNFKKSLTNEIVMQVLPKIESGIIKSTMTKKFALEQVSEAHSYFESPAHFGKIVLSLGS